MDEKINEEKLDLIYEGDPFTMIPNELLVNPDIHPNTRLLYCIIKHYITIPGFVLYKSTLIKSLGLAANTFNKYWKELKDLGFLEQIQHHINGRWKYSYKLHSISLKNTGTQNTGTQNLGYCNTRPCNLGEYNNTDLNNTDNKNLDSTDNYSFFSKLTENQLRDVNNLVKAVGTHQIKSTKESLFSYIQKLSDNNFIDSYGKPIKSLYGYIVSNFNLRSKQDEEEKEIIKAKAEAGDEYSEILLSKYYD